MDWQRELGGRWYLVGDVTTATAWTHPQERRLWIGHDCAGGRVAEPLAVMIGDRFARQHLIAFRVTGQPVPAQCGVCGLSVTVLPEGGADTYQESPADGSQFERATGDHQQDVDHLHVVS